MRIAKHAFPALVAGLLTAGAARAADLAAPPAAQPNCYATFASWLDSSATDCPLSYAGVTLYGVIDVGGGYESAASRFNKDYPNGVAELISKFNNGGRWQLVPNGLSRSSVGVKINEQIAPSWFLIGDVTAGFDPYSLQFGDGPRSLVDNNNVPLGGETANSDSSLAGGWDSIRAYVGLSNRAFGTLTLGRQYAFSNEAASNYDPFAGAYGFSLLGTSATVVSGTGATETARYNTSVKYQLAYNGLRIGALAQIGGWSNGNGAQGAYQADIGADLGGFSADAIYAYARDAVTLSTFTSGAPTPDTLKATLADINAGVVAAKYTRQALTLFGGYEYAQLSTPSGYAGYVGNTYTLNGYPAVVQTDAYVDPKALQVLWGGAKYGLRSDLDAIVAYYHEWQNDYDTSPSANCSANTTPAIPGAAPQGTKKSDCAGTTDAISGALDWRLAKRVDVYAGVMYSRVAGGMASGFIKSDTAAFTTGLRVNF